MKTFRMWRAVSWTSISHALIRSIFGVRSFTYRTSSSFSDSIRDPPMKATISIRTTVTPKPRARRVATFALPNMVFPFLDLISCQKSSLTAEVLRSGRDRALHQRGRVQDQRDLAVAEDGRSADAREPLEQPAERLDDGLEFAEQGVDREPGALAGVVDDDDVLAP